MTIIAVLYLAGLFPPPGIHPGRTITVTTFITFSHGIISFSAIINSILNQNLIMLHEISKYEVYFLLFILLNQIFLFLSDLLVTFEFLDPNTAYVILLISLLGFFIGELCLTLNYLITKPDHTLNPSLLKKYMNTAWTPIRWWYCVWPWRRRSICLFTCWASDRFVIGLQNRILFSLMSRTMITIRIMIFRVISPL